LNRIWLTPRRSLPQTDAGAFFWSFPNEDAVWREDGQSWLGQGVVNSLAGDEAHEGKRNNTERNCENLEPIDASMLQHNHTDFARALLRHFLVLSAFLSVF